MARVVAELGRPETPAETAARKAESSRVYRGSQTMRNLIAALIATVAVVMIIVFMVPRGEIERPPAADVDGTATAVAAQLDTPIISPVVPKDWRANSAKIEGDIWEVIYAPGEGKGFLRVSQGVGVDAGWAGRELVGAQPTEIVTIDGVEWQEYSFRDPKKSGNVSYALSTVAGADSILIFGSSSQDLITMVAEGLTEQIDELKEVTQ